MALPLRQTEDGSVDDRQVGPVQDDVNTGRSTIVSGANEGTAEGIVEENAESPDDEASDDHSEDSTIDWRTAEVVPWFKSGVTRESLVYSHDIAVAALTSLYEFIVRVHRDGSDTWVLKHPPVTGWRGNWDQVVAGGYFTRAAVNLIRFLPRFCHPQSGRVVEGPFLMPDTWFTDHYVGYDKDTVDDPDPEDDELTNGGCNLPPHMVRLTLCGNMYGFDAVVDTETGCVLWQRFFDPFPDYVGWPMKIMYKLDENQQNERLYQSYRAMDLVVFVNTIKECFEKMWWMPRMEIDHGWEVVSCDSSIVTDRYLLHRQDIMRNAGWPRERWDKQKATQDMRAARAQDLIQ
jgi:hypothetical protein